MTLFGRAAEVAIGGGGSIDRIAEIERLDDAARREIEHFADCRFERILRHRPGAERVDHDRYGIGDADGVRDLGFAPLRQPGRNDVFGDPPHRVRGGPINFGGVLAAECSATVPRHAAIAIDDDLAAREPRVTLRPTNNEPPRGVHEHIAVLDVESGFANHRPDHVPDNAGTELPVVDHVGVLRRHHDLVDADRLGALVEHADLCLAVGTQPGQLAGLPHFGQPLRQAMGDHDRKGHQRRRLIRRVPEHHALIACPARVYAERDVGGLAVDRREDGAGLRIEAEVRVGVADRGDRAAHDVGDMDVGRGRDLARDDGHAGRHQRFAGNPGLGIFQQNGVEDRVGDLIRDLVRMSFGDGLGSEDVTMSWHVFGP